MISMISMISNLLPFMRCPRCGAGALRPRDADLACENCGARYPVREGLVDMLVGGAKEVITPFQRVMQTPLVVSIYENLWRRAGYYLASSRSFEREMQTVLRLASGRSRDRVLDLACGPGVFTRPLAGQTDGVVVGLDLSRPMLSHARKRLQREGIPNVLLVRASAFSLPFADGAFRYVNCCGALHLFDRPEAALEEIGRVLAPGGFLSVQTTIRPARSVGMAYVLERFIRFGFFDETGLRELLRRRNFEILESERHRISFTFLAGRSPAA